MDKRPDVSVVVTCYNYAKYLDGCLGSVFAQTYEDYEVIVVDDGSTDETPEVMQKYTDMPKLGYIRQKNGGQARAKNRGIESARGRFIAFLDADDLWEPEKLSAQMTLFSNPSTGVVYSRARYIDTYGAPLRFQPSGQYLMPRSGRVSRWLFMDNFVPFSSSVVRRECFNMYGVFDESLAMGIDWDLWLRLSVGFEFDFVDRPLLAYRVGHPGQMSKNLEVRQQCSDRIMDAFLRNNPGLIKRDVMREAYFYTFCNRGYYFRKINKMKSLKCYLGAIRQKPFNGMAYKRLVKNIIGF
jgi:glycosyltransferase involved in cell wall biosynthesis